MMRRRNVAPGCFNWCNLEMGCRKQVWTMGEVGSRQIICICAYIYICDFPSGRFEGAHHPAVQCRIRTFHSFIFHILHHHHFHFPYSYPRIPQKNNAFLQHQPLHIPSYHSLSGHIRAYLHPHKHFVTRSGLPCRRLLHVPSHPCHCRKALQPPSPER